MCSRGSRANVTETHIRWTAPDVGWIAICDKMSCLNASANIMTGIAPRLV